MAAKKARSRRKAVKRRKAAAGTARTRKAKTRAKPRATARGPARSTRPKAAGRARAKAKPRKRKSRRKKAARRPAHTAARPAAKRRKRPAKTGRRATAKTGVKKKTARKATSSSLSRGSAKAARTSTGPAPQAGRSVRGKPPVLDRERRRLPEPEREAAPAPVPTAEGAGREGGAGPDERLLRSARAGRDELRLLLARHTATGPKLTGGDLDANWHDAYAVGDEAPGGDNPTPDQDRVDEIGRALGVTYQDSQELQGGDEITERDRHRWEYDPASSDDWPHDKDEDKT